MSPKMANMAPKTTQDRVQVGTKIEKKWFQEGLQKNIKKCVKKGDATAIKRCGRGGGSL